jgi:hypothetical protein
MKKLLVFFAAGCAGGLGFAVAVWFSGDVGFTSALGVSYHHSLTPGWLYSRIVWGGIWGILFLLPLPRSSLILKGLILSLLPTAFQLLVVFPLFTGNGIGGLNLGILTPLAILLFNCIWGIVTAVTIQLSK